MLEGLQWFLILALLYMYAVRWRGEDERERTMHEARHLLDQVRAYFEASLRHVFGEEDANSN